MKGFLITLATILCAALVAVAIVVVMKLVNDDSDTTAATSSISSEISSSSADSTDSSSSSADSTDSSSDSTGEVTETQWKAAFAESNFYNVTVKVTGKSSNKVQVLDLKYNLTAHSGSYVTGVVTYQSTVTKNNETESESSYYYLTEYSAENSGYYSYKATDNDSGSFNYSDAQAAEGFTLYDVGCWDVYIPALVDYYSYFTYSDGSYISNIENQQFTVKIADGKVVEVGGIEMDGFTVTYAFSDYGTTQVSVPAGISYTYEQAYAYKYISIVKRCNTMLALDEALNGVPVDVDYVWTVFEDFGYSEEDLAVAEGYTIYWDSSTNCALLWSDSDSAVLYPETDYSGVTSVQSTWYALSPTT